MESCSTQSSGCGFNYSVSSASVEPDSEVAPFLPLIPWTRRGPLQWRRRRSAMVALIAALSDSLPKERMRSEWSACFYWTPVGCWCSSLSFLLTKYLINCFRILLWVNIKFTTLFFRIYLLFLFKNQNNFPVPIYHSSQFFKEECLVFNHTGKLYRSWDVIS